jgi:hypothetical protein
LVAWGSTFAPDGASARLRPHILRGLSRRSREAAQADRPRLCQRAPCLSPKGDHYGSHK